MTLPVPIPARQWLRSQWGLIVLVAAQAVLATALNYYSRDQWPRDDAITYLSQGVLLWLDSFPPDPNRPILYSFILGLGMKLCGLSFFWLRSFQVAGLCVTTLLLYRLARIMAGKKAALLAVIFFAVFPDTVFYANFLYRESVTMLLLMATLNLAQHMLERPKEYVRPLYTGAAAGLLVMLKPEFGTLMALLALAGLIAAIRARDFRGRVLPWIVCGVMALATTLPALLAARAAFGEWIFICVNTGKYYSLSYCDALETGDPAEQNKSYREKDSARFARVNPKANQIFFFSDPSIPYGERDRWLLNKAKECVRQNPKQAVTLWVNRALGTIFWTDQAAASWMGDGDFGPGWSALFVQTLRALALAIDLAVVLLLGPGLYALGKKPEGRLAALTIIWFVAYYSTAYYRVRLRLPIWPVFILAAAAGFFQSREIFQSGSTRARAALILSAALALIAFDIIGQPLGSPLFNQESWLRQKTGEGISADHKRGVLILLADNMEQAGRLEAISEELGPFIRLRKKSLSADLVIAAGDHYFQEKKYSVAAFFYGMARELWGGEKAAGRHLSGQSLFPPEIRTRP